MTDIEEIVIAYSGWCSIAAADVKFQYIGEDESIPQVISGKEYIKLSETSRQDYILESIVDAIKDSDDCEWADIQIIIE